VSSVRSSRSSEARNWGWRAAELATLHQVLGHEQVADRRDDRGEQDADGILSRRRSWRGCRDRGRLRRLIALLRSKIPPARDGISLPRTSCSVITAPSPAEVASFWISIWSWPPLAPIRPARTSAARGSIFTPFAAAVADPVDEVILRVAAEAPDLDLVLDRCVWALSEKIPIEAAAFVRFRALIRKVIPSGSPSRRTPRNFSSASCTVSERPCTVSLRNVNALHPDELPPEEGEGPDRPDRPVDHLDGTVHGVGRKFDRLDPELSRVGRGELRRQISSPPCGPPPRSLPVTK